MHYEQPRVEKREPVKGLLTHGISDYKYKGRWY